VDLRVFHLMPPGTLDGPGDSRAGVLMDDEDCLSGGRGVMSFATDDEADLVGETDMV